MTEWLKATDCNRSACVEVAAVGGRIGIRDSKDPDGPVLWFSREDLATLTAAARAGQFAGLLAGAS